MLFATATPLFAQDEIHPGMSGRALLNALDEDYSPTSWYSYDAARDTLFLRIDREAGRLRGIYTGFTITLTPGFDPTTDAFSQSVNTEHTWPQSMGADEEPAKSDMHHLFPVKANVNSSRSNCPYGEIPDEETDTWYRTDQSATSVPFSDVEEWSEKDNDHPDLRFECRFEPREDHKGDAARAIFYFMTVYPERANAEFFDVQKDVLRLWHQFDQPTAAEQTRSEKIAVHQGSVNPYVIDTTLVRRAFFEGDAGSLGAVTYAFNGNDGCPTTDDGPQVSSAEGVFSDFRRHGVDCNNAQGVFNSRDWPAGDFRSDGFFAGFSGEAPADAPFSFTEGSQISFTVRRSDTGPPNGELVYIKDASAPSSLEMWALDDTDDHDLSVSLVEIGIASFIEFRFYGWGSTSERGTLSFDDVVLRFAIASSAEDSDELPTVFTMRAAHPNPFRSSTTIPLEIEKALHVRVEVFDVLGRRLQVLHDDGVLAPGQHNFTVDARNLPAGVYLVRASGRGHSAGQTLIVMK